MRRRVESIFDAHLDVLRKSAKEKKISFVNILLAATKSTLRSLYGIKTCELSDQQWRRWAERELIERYRIQYYAAWANIALNMNRFKTKTLVAKETNEIIQNALKIQEQRKKSLDIGRKEGAAANKRYSIESIELAKHINNGLLKDLIYIKGGLDKRVEYIMEEFKDLRIMKSKNSNEEYSEITIKGWITGT